MNAPSRPLPTQSRYVDERTQSLNPTTMRCADQRRLVAHAVGVDCGATGNSYGGRSSSDADDGICDRRGRQLYASSDVDLTASVNRYESTTWNHQPSSTDMLSTVNGSDQCAIMFQDLLRGGLSLQTLTDTHL